jgi:probable phosphoglycerate mutase
MFPLGVMFVLSSILSYGAYTSDQTGRTDIPLTQRGEEQIKSKAAFLVGDGSWWNELPHDLI